MAGTKSFHKPQREKVYCDKWVHEGVCAFNQQGCKFKHEMPNDKETQHTLGLFHGYPAWWKKYMATLARPRQDLDEDCNQPIALTVDPGLVTKQRPGPPPRFGCPPRRPVGAGAKAADDAMTSGSNNLPGLGASRHNGATTLGSWNGSPRPVPGNYDAGHNPVVHGRNDADMPV